METRPFGFLVGVDPIQNSLPLRHMEPSAEFLKIDSRFDERPIHVEKDGPIGSFHLQPYPVDLLPNSVRKFLTEAAERFRIFLAQPKTLVLTGKLFIEELAFFAQPMEFFLLGSKDFGSVPEKGRCLFAGSDALKSLQQFRMTQGPAVALAGQLPSVLRPFLQFGRIPHRPSNQAHQLLPALGDPTRLVFPNLLGKIQVRTHDNRNATPKICDDPECGSNLSFKMPGTPFDCQRNGDQFLDETLPVRKSLGTNPGVALQRRVELFVDRTFEFVVGVFSQTNSYLAVPDFLQLISQS